MNLEVKERAAWVKKLVRETGTKGIVVGLSGGKDSAAVAAICVMAGVPVLGINLPIKSNPEDMEYVNKLLKALPAIEFEQINLNSAFEALKDTLGLDPDRDKLTCANIKARLRMTTIYAKANQRNYLVAGTDNACESYVGYFTKWGDGAFDFNLLGDLTVDEVIQVGIEAGAPEECMRRTPSAGLWAGQTDENEMGVTYKAISALVRNDYSLAPNVSVEEFEKIERMHRNTEHKRIAAPAYNMFQGTSEDR